MRGVFDFHKFCFLGSILVLSAGISACGPMENGHYVTVSSDYGLTGAPVSAATTPSTSSSNKFQCPSLNNVVPVNYQSYASGQFEVCSDSQSQTDLKVVSGSEGNDQICVFPANSSLLQSGMPSALRDPTTGTSIFGCVPGPITGAGMIFTFQNIVQGATWDSVYIVAGRNAAALDSCLRYAVGTPQCPSFPDYSYGKLK